MNCRGVPALRLRIRLADVRIPLSDVSTVDDADRQALATSDEPHRSGAMTLLQVVEAGPFALC